MTSVNTILKDLRQYATEASVPVLRQECEQLLSEVIRREQPMRLLEIGTAIGYSSIIIASNMPVSATLVTIEIDAARAAAARKSIADAGLGDRVTVLTGDALAILGQLTSQFDFVFLDGPKGQYLTCLRLLLDKLASSAVVVADNVLFRGMVNSDNPPPRRYRTLVRRLRDYLAFVSTDDHFTTTLLSDGDGVAISYYHEH